MVLILFVVLTKLFCFNFPIRLSYYEAALRIAVTVRQSVHSDL